MVESGLGIHWIRGAVLQKSLSPRGLACERIQDRPAEEGVRGEEHLRKRKALVLFG